MCMYVIMCVWEIFTMWCNDFCMPHHLINNMCLHGNLKNGVIRLSENVRLSLGTSALCFFTDRRTWGRTTSKSSNSCGSDRATASPATASLVITAHNWPSACLPLRVACLWWSKAPRHRFHGPRSRAQKTHGLTCSCTVTKWDFVPVRKWNSCWEWWRCVLVYGYFDE